MSVSDRPPLSTVLARDAMQVPLVACDPGSTVPEVASLMASHRVYAVIVESISVDEHHELLRWAVVSDLDLARAAVLADDTATAGDIAGTEALTVDAGDDLVTVADRLVDHDCGHAIVVDGGRPVGVISTLDLALAVAS